MTEARAFLDGGSAPRDVLNVATVPAKLPAHRPSEYSIEVAQAFCEKIADGMSLRKICELPEFPAKSTIFHWLALHIEFQVMYCGALRWKSSMRADEIIEIADDDRDDWRMEPVDPENKDAGSIPVFNKQAVARSRVRIDARKWVVSKEYPERYGDKLAQVLPPARPGTGAPGDDAKLIGQNVPIDEHPLKNAMDAWKNRSLVIVR